MVLSAAFPTEFENTDSSPGSNLGTHRNGSNRASFRALTVEKLGGTGLHSNAANTRGHQAGFGFLEHALLHDLGV